MAYPQVALTAASPTRFPSKHNTMTLAELNALIQARLPDNSRNQITAADLRAVAEALAATAIISNSSTTPTSAPRSSAHRLFLFNFFV